MATVLVAGCGYVGMAFAELAANKGHDVVALRRTAHPMPPGVRLVQADLLLPESLNGLPDGIELVAYAAAADASTDEAYERTYVTGLSNLLQSLKRRGAPIRRVLFTSSTGVYGQADGSWVDETSPTAPESFTGTRMLEGERVLFESGFPAIALRLGGIYGPGRTRLIDMVKSGQAKRATGPVQYTNLIHRDDCAGAIAHLLSHPNPQARYNGVDCEPCDRNALLEWLATQLRVPAPPFGSTEDVKAHRPVGNKRCSNRLLRESGFQFRFPDFRAGFSSMIEGVCRSV
jgi:nucleoside-diphosphate-sugar epimerase